MRKPTIDDLVERLVLIFAPYPEDAAACERFRQALSDPENLNWTAFNDIRYAQCLARDPKSDKPIFREFCEPIADTHPR